MSNISNNKRIAVNTMMLYFRMFLTMGVSLFTSRIVLQSLGVSDFGIYNVVAGFVSTFTFVNSAMTNATQRYITFALGRGDKELVNTVFCTCLNIHGLISILLILTAETFGLWFLNTQMTIPADRIAEANIVFQLAILSTVVMMLSVPYNALIVAYEKMSAFAYISIFDVTFKLIIAYVLFISPVDRLIVYAVLMFVAQATIRFIYQVYCNKHFSDSKFCWKWDKPLFKEMISFSGWSLFGNLASVFSGQGVNVVLNMFFGPAVNAARGVTFQVQSAVSGFSSNFQTAMNPQIMKNYATGNLSSMHTLIFASSKYSYYLMLLISLPVILEADVLLSFWLTEVPEHTCNFLRIVLFSTVINAMAGPFTISAQANGNIKAYQATVGGILLLSLPISYIGLKIYNAPEVVYIIDLGIVIGAQIARVFFMRWMIRLSIREYLTKVIIPVILVTIASCAFPVLLLWIMPRESISSFITVCAISVICVSFSVFLFGINNNERTIFVKYIKNRVLK